MTVPLRNISGNNSWSGALTLGAASTIASDSGTLTLSGTIANGGFLATFAGAGDVAASGVISGAGALTKSGAGKLTLSGANTFGGVLTVSAGTVSISTINNVSAAGVLGNSANAVVLGASGATGTLEYTGATASSTKTFTMAASGTGAFDVTVGANTLTLSGVINGSGGLTKAGAGTLTLSGANIYTGTTTISAGTLQIGNGGTTGTLGSGNVTDDAALVFNRSDAVSYGGVISGTGTLTKNGAGTLTLSGANTYSGTTTVSLGKIKVQNNTALGNTTGATTVASGAAIQIDGTGLVVAENISSLIGDGGGNGAVENLLNANTESGTITFGADARINSDAGTLTLSGATISGNGHAMTFGGAAGNITISSIISGAGSPLTYDGGGTLTLTGANTYAGDTTVKSGTLVVGANAPSGSAGVLGNAVSAVLLGDTVGSLNASLLAGGAFSIGRNITVQSGSSGTATLGGNTAAVSTFSGNIPLNKSAILTAASGGEAIFSGVISGVTLASPSPDSGTVTLSAPTPIPAARRSPRAR